MQIECSPPTGPDHILIANGRVALRAAVENGVLAVMLSAIDAQGRHIPILTRADVNRSVEPLQVERPEKASMELHELSDSALLVVRGGAGGGELSICFRLYEGSSWVEVAELYAAESKAGSALPRVDWMEAVWRFVEWAEPGEVFSPVLVPEHNDVIGRHVMRSPAVAAQTGGRAAALINDVDQIGRAQALPACMNLLREGGAPVFRTGLRPHKVRGHVYFEYAADPQRAERLHHSYQLFVAAEAAEGAALEAAAGRLWQRWGRRNHRAGGPGLTRMPMRYEDYARAIYPRAFEQSWIETELDGRRVGAITINRSYPHDVWMCPWFSQIRSAYGLYLWGQWLGNADWMSRAVATRDLHLAMPQDRGMFPTVCVLDPTPGAREPCRWVHSHHQGGGPGIYHLFDMSWTVYQLLRWHRDVLPDARTLDFARRYAQGIVALQSADGGLPSYIDARTLAPIRRVDTAALAADLRTYPGGSGYVQWGVEKGWGAERFVTSAEDSTTLLCLAELARLLPADDAERPGVLAAARASAAWLEGHIFPAAGWTDFEVYYSCSAKGLDFYDHRSGQGPQNTLCMHTAAAGLLVLYELVHERRYLDLACRALRRMSLYQQIWSPPFLNFQGFGGYGVMNTDGEWSDARQGQFADTHLDFYRVQGDGEQLERAQAACRAGFATVFHPGSAAWYPNGWDRRPMGLAAENHGHGGFDSLNGVSSFDWGSGSALATAAYLKLHDALE